MNGAARALRTALLTAARGMKDARLNTGSAGNASVRTADGMLITPSGMAPEECTEHDLVALGYDGRYRAPVRDGMLAPSSEWRLHADLYRTHANAGAIIHSHAPFATALACQRLDIPPFHYMIARFGGNDVRCARYATFGTQALSDHVREAMDGRCACLLANHGMVVIGDDPRHALSLAIEFEALCEQYWRTLQLGPPVLLGADEMRAVSERFTTYGRPRKANGTAPDSTPERPGTGPDDPP